METSRKGNTKVLADLVAIRKSWRYFLLSLVINGVIEIPSQCCLCRCRLAA